MNAIIVSKQDKSIPRLAEMLKQGGCTEVAVVCSCTEARRRVAEESFTYAVINAPLPDEYGDVFAEELSEFYVNEVLILVKEGDLEDVRDRVADSGVFTLGKPLNFDSLWCGVRLMFAANKKLARLAEDNRKLSVKLAGFKTICRAKCALIEKRGYTEAEAHYEIEKRAMDERKTREVIAQKIIEEIES